MLLPEKVWWALINEGEGWTPELNSHGDSQYVYWLGTSDDFETNGGARWFDNPDAVVAGYLDLCENEGDGGGPFYFTLVAVPESNFSDCDTLPTEDPRLPDFLYPDWVTQYGNLMGYMEGEVTFDLSGTYSTAEPDDDRVCVEGYHEHNDVGLF